MSLDPNIYLSLVLSAVLNLDFPWLSQDRSWLR